jgi:hypothetical protein
VQALGDHEHIASNIGQARRILADYQARGGNFEAFLLLMYDARDLARQKTKIRRSNRMPYFFACLRTACSFNEKGLAQSVQVALQGFLVVPIVPKK